MTHSFVNLTPHQIDIRITMRSGKEYRVSVEECGES